MPGRLAQAVASCFYTTLAWRDLYRYIMYRYIINVKLNCCCADCRHEQRQPQAVAIAVPLGGVRALRRQRQKGCAGIAVQPQNQAPQPEPGAATGRQPRATRPGRRQSQSVAAGRAADGGSG